MLHENIIKCIAIFLETFIHEDLAIMTGGVFASNGSLPVITVFLTLVAGMITGDTVIYGIGWGARKVPWIYRKVFSEKMENAKEKIHRNLIKTVVFVRLVPGLLFPTFTACGFTGVPYRKFILTTSLAGTVYTAVFLTILLKVGKSFVPSMGHWAWIVVVMTGLVIITYRLLAQRKIAAVTADNSVVAFQPELTENREELSGMPSLSTITKRVSLSERIPPFIFYSPVALRWVMLGIRYHNLLLPTVSNPYVEAGGLWGESKSRLMDQIGDEEREWVAKYTTAVIRHGAGEEDPVKSVVSAMKESCLDFPVVVKPDIGWQGYGVRVINAVEELRDYLNEYPHGIRVIVQELITWDGEAGIFYSRLPGEEHGRVISVTLRYYPHVIGDGISTVRQLINNNERTRFKNRYYTGKESLHSGLTEEKLNAIPSKGEIFRLAFIGSIRVGGLYRDGSEYITEHLNRRVDSIGRSMREFYFGRFDVRFKSLDHLMDGEDFRIFEINGAGAEAIHVWDASTPLLKMYRELFHYQSLMFKISAQNRKRGFKPMNMKDFYSFTRNYNNLISSYPTSE
jgi:membrane protein DedA with SNARE-associated domain